MKTEIKKKFNGHDIYINDNFVMWVIGSKRNAQKELQKYFKEIVI